MIHVEINGAALDPLWLFAVAYCLLGWAVGPVYIRRAVATATRGNATPYFLWFLAWVLSPVWAPMTLAGRVIAGPRKGGDS